MCLEEEGTYGVGDRGLPSSTPSPLPKLAPVVGGEQFCMRQVPLLVLTKVYTQKAPKTGLVSGESGTKYQSRRVSELIYAINKRSLLYFSTALKIPIVSKRWEVILK